MDWKLVKATDFINFKREIIPKGTMAKKVAMEQLQPFTRDISGSFKRWREVPQRRYTYG